MTVKNCFLLTLVFYFLININTALAVVEDNQTTPSSPQSELQANEEQADTISMLDALIQLEHDIRQQTAAVKEKLNQSTSEIEKENLKNKLVTLDRQLMEAGDDFERIATNIDIALFIEKKPEAFSWQTEFAELVQPAIKELKRFTIRSRKKTKLRDTISEYKKLLPVAGEAIEHLNVLINTTQNKDIKRQLNLLLPEWQKSVERLSNKLDLAQRELGQLERKDSSLTQTLSKETAEFFRERGIFLFGALAAFFLTLFLCQFIFSYLFTLLPWGREKHKPFYIRFLDLSVRILGFVLAIFSGFLILYFAEDWFLLSLAIIFLIGFTWTLRQGLSKLWQQARLLLNIGAVREGERITLDGVPWKVERIHLFCKLYNPSLDMRINIPVENMIGEISRPFKPEEPWFPCHRGDWIVVGDAPRGRVVSLSHEAVELVERGGKRIFYQTQDFLASAPVNLSRNFRLKVTFGVSYNQQAIATSEIPETFLAYIEERFKARGYDKSCLNLSVEFSQAGESSLDMVVLADFAGEVADIYARLERFIQRCCVEACTKNNWEIPFPQLTVHKPNT